MKAIIAIIALVIVCLLLGMALMEVKNKAASQQTSDSNRIASLTTELKQVSAQREEQKQVNITLTTNLNLNEDKLREAAGTIVQLKSDLVRAKADAEANARTAEANAQNAALLRASLEKEQAEVARLKNELQGLNTERDAMSRHMGDLTNAITALEGRINDTQRQLATAQGDRDFLYKELKRLQAEKAELERQLNDLVFLREQVRKLKDELSVGRRLDWIRHGLYGDQKGAERLMILTRPPPPPIKTNYDLNVELKTDGSAKILPRRTNAPPPTAPK